MIRQSILLTILVITFAVYLGYEPMAGPITTDIQTDTYVNCSGARTIGFEHCAGCNPRV
jgi:hypothetical protein